MDEANPFHSSSPQRCDIREAVINFESAWIISQAGTSANAKSCLKAPKVAIAPSNPTFDERGLKLMGWNRKVSSLNYTRDIAWVWGENFLHTLAAIRRCYSKICIQKNKNEDGRRKLFASIQKWIPLKFRLFHMSNEERSSHIRLLSPKPS